MEFKMIHLYFFKFSVSLCSALILNFVENSTKQYFLKTEESEYHRVHSLALEITKYIIIKISIKIFVYEIIDTNFQSKQSSIYSMKRLDFDYDWI